MTTLPPVPEGYGNALGQPEWIERTPEEIAWGVRPPAPVKCYLYSRDEILPGENNGWNWGPSQQGGTITHYALPLTTPNDKATPAELPELPDPVEALHRRAEAAYQAAWENAPTGQGHRAGILAAHAVLSEGTVS